MTSHEPAPPPTYPQPAPVGGLAIAAFVIGVIALLTGLAPVWGIVAGVSAIILGALALKRLQSKGFAVTGLVLGAVAAVSSLVTTTLLVVVLVIATPPSARAPEPVPSYPADAVAPGDPAPCEPSEVQVTGVVDASAFQPGEFPMISLMVESSAAEACTIQAGTDVQEFRILSGSEVVWSSTHCQEGAQPYTQVLEPGIPVSTAPMPWDRTASSPDGCGAERGQVPAGGASYWLSVEIGGHASTTEPSFLLN